MQTLDQWLEEYAASHQNPTNQAIHKICVPLITLTLVAMLWAVPVPEAFQNIKFFNWATVFMSLCLVFYAFLSLKMFLLMSIQTGAMFALFAFVGDFQYLFHVAFVVFAICWVFQLYGHRVEGAKPSFFKDLTFLLIGPLWVMKKLFNV